MPFAGHDLPDFICIIIAVKGYEVLPGHEIADRHALVNQTGRRICVVSGGNDRTSSVLGNLLDGHGHACALTHNDAVSPHLDGAELGLITVAQYNQVMGFNVKFHQVRIGGCNQYLSLVKIDVRIPHHNISFQCFNDVGILGMGLGQDAAVIYIHISLCDIAYRDKPFQGTVGPDGRNGHHIVFLHDVPCPF